MTVHPSIVVVAILISACTQTGLDLPGEFGRLPDAEGSSQILLLGEHIRPTLVRWQYWTAAFANVPAMVPVEPHERVGIPAEVPVFKSVPARRDPDAGPDLGRLDVAVHLPEGGEWELVLAFFDDHRIPDASEWRTDPISVVNFRMAFRLDSSGGGWVRYYDWEELPRPPSPPVRLGRR